MYYEQLYPEQKAVVDLLLSDLRTSGKAALIAGQRSGKTLIEAAVAEKLGKGILFGSSSHKSAAANYEGFMHLFFKAADVSEIDPDTVEDCLVVLDEGLYYATRSLFEGLTVPVLLVSSATDEFVEGVSGWNGISYYTYATWELNPAHTPSSIRTQFSSDKKGLWRDFCRVEVEGCLNPLV